MDIIKFILIIILMFVLRNLVHNRYHFIYFNGFTGIFMEFVIFFLLAAAIVLKGSSMIGSLFTPKEKDPGFYGTYYNLDLLEGGEAETYIQISNNGDSKDGMMSISGDTSSVARVLGQHLSSGEIEIPDGNTFTYTDEAWKITLTITADPKNHTLEVIQESGIDDVPFWFTGKYVDQDTWEQMGDEVKEAKEKAIAAQTPNKWIAEYFDEYILRSYAIGEKGSHPAQFSIYENPDYNITSAEKDRKGKDGGRNWRRKMGDGANYA